MKIKQNNVLVHEYGYWIFLFAEISTVLSGGNLVDDLSPAGPESNDPM